jgi:hypothetical protein
MYMKTRLFIGNLLNRTLLAVLSSACLFGSLVAASAATGAVPLNPSAIQLPPGPPPSLSGGYEGYSVAGSSRFLVIGRPGATVEYGGTNIPRAGSVVVWELDESYLVDDVVKKRFWVIDAFKPIDSHYWGTAVAAGDRWVAVAGGLVKPGFGGPGGTPPKTNHVQLIEFPPDGGWLPGPELPGPADSVYRRTALFGSSVAMHRNRLVVGSLLGALVYEVDSLGVWSRTQILNTNSPHWNGFGMVVAIHNDLIAVGAPGSPSSTTNGLVAGQGGVIVYRRQANGLYVPEKELRHSAVEDDDVLNRSEGFGTSLALEVRDGIEWLAVGSPGRDAQLTPNSFQPDAGSAVLFRRFLPSGEWTFHQEITNSFNNQLTQRARSGNTIALSNGRLAVGAVAEGGTQTPPAHGVVGHYRYDKDQDRWIRSGETRGLSRAQYGLGLHGFEHGFLVGSPFADAGGGGNSGGWEWRPTDPYVAFINSGSGPAFAGTPAQDRRADADPDGDGIPNSEELFFGTPPLTANTQSIFAPSTDTVEGLFKLQWQQASNTFGVTSKMTWATHMDSAEWTTNGVRVADLGSIPGTTNRRYEARVSIADQKQIFFRLLVE